MGRCWKCGTPSGLLLGKHTQFMGNEYCYECHGQVQNEYKLKKYNEYRQKYSLPTDLLKS